MLRRFGKIIVALLLLGAVTTFVVAALLALVLDLRQGPAASVQWFDGNHRWIVTRWDSAGATRVQSTRTRGLEWGPEQAAGEPDSPGPGDQVSAWASLLADGGTEWLILHFPEPVTARELHVYENHAPGALFKVTALDEAGNETEAWSGTDPSAAATINRAFSPNGVAISKIPLALPDPVQRVKIYLASDKVFDWNEIDAVALITDTGRAQWAKHVEASSTYASGGRAMAGGVSPGMLLPTWCTLDRVSPGFASGAAKREERVADARGWPMLALSSETDVTPAPAGGAAAVTPNASWRPRRFGGDPMKFPTRPIWSGVAVDTLFFAFCWLALWAVLTIPRRFVRDLARLRRGACINCGYDLGFNFIGGCPECGWRRAPAGRTHAPP
jgi:hypothetical protein